MILAANVLKIQRENVLWKYEIVLDSFLVYRQNIHLYRGRTENVLRVTRSLING